MSKPKLKLKATFNIVTKEFTVTGKGINPLKTIIDNEWEDYWDCVTSKETGEPIYDVNLFFDDFANDGGEESNPKNYQAQYVSLKKDGDNYEVQSDYESLPLKVFVK